ncbi:MAG: pseudouridine synthase [Ruminococcaceae bacterium]|nr:pseudouridine synthase [Oscillospiraceae bacterium]
MFEYYMFHKPRGCITARRDDRQKTVMDYFPEEKRDVIFPVGRLDKDTEGLLIFTNDGDFCYRLMMPEYEVPKTYFFWAKGTLATEQISEIESGVKIYKNKEFVTSFAKISIERVETLDSIKHLLCDGELKRARKRRDTPVFCGYITITEGKKHQVKRMLAYAGCKVLYLKRIKIGELSLDEALSLGEYRRLSEAELELIKSKCI